MNELIQIFSACLGAAGGVQPGRDDGGQHLRDYDNLSLQGEDQDKLRLTMTFNHGNKDPRSSQSLVFSSIYLWNS